MIFKNLLFFLLLGAFVPAHAVTQVVNTCGQVGGVEQQGRVLIDDLVFYIEPQDIAALTPLLVESQGQRICFTTTERGTRSYINRHSISLDPR